MSVEIVFAGSRTGSIWQKIIRLICNWICPKAYTCDELPQLIFAYLNALSECVKDGVQVWDYRKLLEIHQKTFSDRVGAIIYDLKYRIPNLETIKKIIELDWTNYRRYVSEFFDCDDFARVFKAHLLEIWRINGVGYVVGEVRDAKTNQLLGYHGWNCIITSDGKVYFYEPQRDWIEEVKDGKAIFRDKYVYIPYWVEY